ncbi:MAG: hypothetical protein ABJA37_12925 [Ferruginibacter sp.]
MVKNMYFFSTVLLLCSFNTHNNNRVAEEVSWETLSNIILKEVWSNKYKMKIKKPVFDASIRKLNGRMISIAGFLIPITTYGKDYVISANPYSGCYFCGNAGIETIIELKFDNNNIRHKTDRYLVVEGKLILNEGDDLGFIYTLQNAKEVQ